MLAYPVLVSAQRFDFGRELCYVAFDDNTYLPVTRANICEHKIGVSVHFWNYIHNRLIRYSHASAHPPKEFQESVVRLAMDDGKRKWYVDAHGWFVSDGCAGRIPANIKRRIIRRLEWIVRG